MSIESALSGAVDVVRRGAQEVTKLVETVWSKLEAVEHKANPKDHLSPGAIQRIRNGPGDAAGKSGG